MMLLKVIITYEKRFWAEDIGQMILLHTEKHKPIELSTSLKELFNKEKIDSATVNTIIEAIHRYDVLPSTNVPTLICWLTGSAALLTEDLGEQVVGQLCHEVLCDYMNVSSKLSPIIQVLKYDTNLFVI